MNEEMRKEFEAWCIDNDLSYQMSFGQYHNATTSNYWRIWKASREAMKPIKLPDIPTIMSIDYRTGFKHSVYECEEAIQQAGYKVEK